MENNFQVKLSKRFTTAQFISKISNSINSQNMSYFQQKIGSGIFMFQMVEDKHQKTVLKTSFQVRQFLQTYNAQFKTNFDINQIQGGVPFDLSKKMISQTKFYETFFQFYYDDIFHIKMITANRKSFSKRWYDGICSCFDSQWERRNILLTSQGILELEQNKVTDFLLIDSYFQFFNGSEHTGYEYGILFTSTHRKMLIRASNAIDYAFFLYYMYQAVSENHQKIMKHGASSVPRLINNLQFIVDAQIYFKKVAEALQTAKEQVFMTGWWISPELPLIRPYNNHTQKYRLDNLLKSLARRGVHIYIIVFANPPVIPNDSDYTQSALTNLHSNIKVLTHPSNIIPGIWTHHQKIVVIDQRLAFLGGIDLCYGRYDDHTHTISSNSKQMYPGIEYNNNRLKDFVDVSNYKADGLPRNQPRMPWHDVAQVVTGKILVDISRHFIEYWNNSYFEAYVLQDTNIKTKIKRQLPSVGMFEQESKHNLNTNQSIFKIFKNSQKIIKNSQMKNKQRSQFNKIMKQIQKPKDSTVYQMDKKILSLSIESLGLIKLKEQEWQKKKKNHPDHCQLLRSASEWSIGLEQGLLERSIQNAYLHYIQTAEHFIFIENQFFISATGQQDSFVSNKIATALYDRIKKAVQKKQKFKVIVFMPLLPGMQGDLNNNPPMALQLVIHWQYKTISRGEHSLFGRLKKITPKPQNYLQFYGLRQHGVLQGKPVTQMLYIHSKLMIVDDKIAICGSANVNDRSQEGDRDSQLCILVSNGEKVESKMGGQPYQVVKKVHELRVQLFQEHFEFQPKDCADPLDESLIKNMRMEAKVNTETYRQLFGCYPDDKIKKLSEGKLFEKNPSLQEYNQYSPNIRGHAVEFPLHYLQNEDLSGLDISLINDITI